MRELSTDRPDQTESPHTVDAGHLQLEMDFFNHVRDRDRSRGRNVRTTELSVAPLNLKVGLLNHVDLQLMFDPYVRLRTEDRATGISERVSGVGDITTRLKINLWGNDSGPSAFALLPFVKLPLSASKVRNGETEGGMFAIVGQALPAGWGAAAMTGVEFVSDGAGGHDNEYINSLALSRALTAHWGAYIEFFSVTGSAPGFRWQGQLDLGFTYALTEDTQFDFGCNFGVTKAAADYQPFVGVSQRF